MEITEELKLSYPCEWEYKLFIPVEHDAHTIVKEIIDERLHTFQPAQTSKNGTYKSYSIKLFVHNDDERKALFDAFKSHTHIKFVL